MALISLQEVDMGYGGPLLLEKANLNIEKGERLCLLGRNGCGKSTLMKLINGDIEPLGGRLFRQSGMKVARLIQQVPANISGTVYNEVTAGLGIQGELLNRYHEVSTKLATDHDNNALLSELDKLGHQIEAKGGWDLNNQVDQVISKMKLNPDELFKNLSAGLKRRVHLAKALVSKPDLLLLDEPTNHLDIDSIDWIEQFLSSCRISLLFITHDRAFLKKLATRIIEIDRGKLTNYDCDYETYLNRKQMALDAELAQNEQFDKKLAEEEVWIRKGIQGRRTRNEGRVRSLVKMREDRRARKKRQGKVKMQLHDAELSGNLVVEAKKVQFAYGDNKIVNEFSTTIMRGDKIGIIGPNGTGKTTLLKLLLGQLTPQSGNIKLGTKIELAYFDQLHSQLDDNKTVMDNVADGYKTITINGKPRNVVGYLEDFLFLPTRARTLVSSLSGGERNRLLLAKIFTKPSNVLVLDEPTNDLDIETLELLEELLQNYNGTVLMVSHDRQFLNNVVTSTIVFEGGGAVKEYVGGYDDYLRQLKTEQDEIALSSPKAEKSEKADKTADKKLKPKSKKLSYKEKRELESLPDKIDELEAELDDIHKAMADSDFYKQPSDQITEKNQRAEKIQSELDLLYKRWDELESLA